MTPRNYLLQRKSDETRRIMSIQHIPFKATKEEQIDAILLSMGEKNIRCSIDFYIRPM
jgi:hypothetical protein